jgi:hypothetical protein
MEARNWAFASGATKAVVMVMAAIRRFRRLNNELKLILPPKLDGIHDLPCNVRQSFA